MAFGDEALSLRRVIVSAAAAASLVAGVTDARAQSAYGAPTAVREAVATSEAPRELRQRELDGFVRRVTAVNNGQSLARWTQPFCPVVSGMTEAQGEYVLARLFQVAKAAGAPAIEDGQCQANVYIVATADPRGLLKAWDKRAPQIFGAATAEEARRFQDSPRPVRSWYTVRVDRPMTSANAPFEGGGPDGLDALPRNTGVSHHADDTRLHSNSPYALTSAIVVVDSGRVAGTRVGALADFIALAALAQLQPDPDAGGAPSILGLFSATKGSAPPDGLTAWDTAFLHALYHTSLEDLHQGTTIAIRMNEALDAGGGH